MKREALESMSAAELDAYAKLLGVSVRGAKGAEQKRRVIESRRGRSARMAVLGVDIEVPIRRAHDKRVSDLLSGGRTDEDMVEAFRLLVGDEQFAAVEEACTEDDGLVDVEAFAFAVASVLGNGDLKNF